MVVPVRGHLDAVRRPGRGCKQRGLQRSLYANDSKVSEFGRQTAIERFTAKLSQDTELQENLHTLQANRTVPR